MVSTPLLWLLATATHILHGEAHRLPLHQRQQAASQASVVTGSSLPSDSVPISSRASDDPATLSFPTTAPTVEASSVFPPNVDPAVSGGAAILGILQEDLSFGGTSTSDGDATISSVSGSSPSTFIEKTSIIDTSSLFPLSSTNTASDTILNTGSPVAGNSALASVRANDGGGTVLAHDETASGILLDEGTATGTAISGGVASEAS
ncbi:MAG: hypothetical protein Q9208_008525 [Pyrenodesmia sp. 3 TL-2023]